MLQIDPEQIKHSSQDFGFDQISIVALARPLTIEFYRAWIEQLYHGDMGYLKNHLAIKENPRAHYQQSRSAIVVTKSYVPHPAPRNHLAGSRVAKYARGDDYHHWFRRDLESLCQKWRAQFPGEEFLSMTDSQPILERDLARQAGLGWVGKNTCLIHPQKGSLFFIGEIYTSLIFRTEPTAAMPDFCGTCTRCLDACPTGALIEPRKMDARLCISYLTIESKSVPPPELREKIGDWFFGCDICQTVCPWNEKVFQFKKNEPGLNSSILPRGPIERDAQIADLAVVLRSSGKALQKMFAGTALSRAGSFGLKRNAIVVATNLGLSELREDIESLMTNERLRDLCTWSLARL